MAARKIREVAQAPWLIPGPAAVQVMDRAQTWSPDNGEGGQVVAFDELRDLCQSTRPAAASAAGACHAQAGQALICLQSAIAAGWLDVSFGRGEIGAQ